eukprot:scaffold25193_cov41-Cyclotella_meneghiniana.AAC.2
MTMRRSSMQGSDWRRAQKGVVEGLEGSKSTKPWPKHTRKRPEQVSRADMKAHRRPGRMRVAEGIRIERRGSRCCNTMMTSESRPRHTAEVHIKNMKLQSQFDDE